MVVKEDGTKWACQSCLKGHRVSGCQHVDRELTLVPKKGRPVTQCHHCRQERKKRSAHVSCDCGQADKQHHPKEKCIHLREAEERAKAGYQDDPHLEKDPAHLAAVAEEQGCCCHHGGKCTCAILKKETDDGSTAPHGPAVKPRLEKTSSDTAITVFTNGHHKPVHRKNHAAHEAGMPYKMPMPRSQTEQSVSSHARRSVDSLALDVNVPYQSSSFPPPNSTTFNAARRMSKSEQPSPSLAPTSQSYAESKLNPIDINSFSQTQANQGMYSAVDAFGFPSASPMSGMEAWGQAPWLMPNNNPFDAWPSSNDSSSTNQPALTAASSGTTSEIDEMPQMDDVHGVTMPSIQEDVDFGLMKVPSGNSPQVNRRSLPPSFFGNIDMNNVYPEWMNPMDGFNTNPGSKAPMQSSNLSTSYNEPWQQSQMRGNGLAQRAFGGQPGPVRPQSRSLGPANAPNDDIIKQLFPDFDMGSYGVMGSPQMSLGADKSLAGGQQSAPTSMPVNYSPMDADVGFTAQTWTDGSLSMPNDPFASSYGMNQGFSNQDFSAEWPQ